MILTRISETAARYPDKVAIQVKTGDRYEKHSYRGFLRNVASAAAALSGHGIGKGDRVALLSENRPEWMTAYLSVLAAGGVIVPLDAQLTDKEVKVLLASSEAKAVFVSKTTISKIPTPHSIAVVSFDRADDGLLFEEMLNAYPDVPLPAPPSDGDLAALLYTSGTTGDPKAVMLSHGNLESNAVSLTKINIVKPEDNMLCLLPLHHTYPSMACMLLPLVTGATVTILNSLKGPDITACMRETRISIMLGVPQLFAGLRKAIFDEIRKKPAPVRLLIRFFLVLNGLLRKAGMNIGKSVFGKVHERFGPALRLFASGGAKLEPDIYTDMINLGFTVIEGYGLTETSPVCTFNPISRPKAGSIGIPVPGVDVRLANIDTTGQGELAVRGPNVMLGYYKKPQETAAVLKEGWFYTGDLGLQDRDGYFFITGRSKEMIVLPNGKNIFPEELEKFYKEAPSVKEFCLIEAGRGLEAAVVPDFEYLRTMNLSNSREVIAFELEDRARELPPYKRISGFKIFKESLPATRLGKLKRALVKDLYMKSGERAEKQVDEADVQLLSTGVGRKLLECLEPFSAKKNIVPDDNLELDLGLDSLARVELVVSIEKSFGVRLPESFGSEIFTVKDAVIRLGDLLSSGQVKTGQVRLSWADILMQEPDPETRKELRLETGVICNAGKFLLKNLLFLVFKAYNRLSVQGLENIPANGPFILAPNHLSLVDAPAVMAALPWRIGSRTFFLGATAYFGGPVTSGIAKVIQVIPVDMESRLQGALQLSAHVLRNGKILGVFPEGSRSRDGRIKEFKKGVGIIARELNITIVPVAIKGTYEILATGRTLPRPAKVNVTFGRPFQPNDMNYDEIVAKLYDDVAGLIEKA